MNEIVLTTHTKFMLIKRKIDEAWVWRTLSTPDRKRLGDDLNMHYSKTIREENGRVLHVVVNTDV